MRENQSKSKQAKVILGLFVFLGLLTVPVAYAAEIADTIPAPKAEISDAELAQKILNPVAAMVSVPFIFLGDYGIGPDDGNRVTLSIQPVIPFELNEKWNLITRTLIPVLYQHNIPAGTSAFGLGNNRETTHPIRSRAKLLDCRHRSESFRVGLACQLCPALPKIILKLSHS